MSWEFKIFKTSSDAASASLGSCKSVRSAIDQHVEEVDWVLEPSLLEMMDKTADALRDEGWDESLIQNSMHANCYGHAKIDLLEFHFTELNREPLESFQIEVEGKGDPFEKVRKLCCSAGWNCMILLDDMSWQDLPVESEKIESKLDIGPENRIQGEIGKLDLAMLRDGDNLSEIVSNYPPQDLIPWLREQSLNVQPAVLDSILTLCAGLMVEEASELVCEIGLRPAFPLLCFPTLCRALQTCCGMDGFTLAAAIIEQQDAEAMSSMTCHLTCFENKDAILDWMEFFFMEQAGDASPAFAQLAFEQAVCWGRLSRWLRTESMLTAIALDVVLLQLKANPDIEHKSEVLYEIETIELLEDANPIQARIGRIRGVLS